MITATRRLARELRRLHDGEMVADGREAWESADILPWQAWVLRCHDLQTASTAGAPTTLSDTQLQLVWQDIVQSDVARHHAGEEPLWNVEATATAAIGSLRLLREWCITADDLPPSRHPDHAGFRRWLRAFETLCTDRGWIDRHLLPDRLDVSAPGDMGKPLLLAGFDHLTAQQQRLVERLAEHGTPVAVLAAARGDFSTLPCHVYQDADAQWRAAAGWALACLSEEPSARLAIVVPDLADCREDIISALTETLAPAYAVGPGESRDLPFHVSLGDSLADHPLARGLMNLLAAVSGQRLTLEQTGVLLMSPVAGNHQEELQARATAALTLRRTLPWVHDIDDILVQLPELGCPLLAARLGRARARVIAEAPDASLSAHSATITGIIDDLGWPGGELALDSDGYQAREAIREQVIGLGSLELVYGHTGLARALTLLERLLALKTFQPEASASALEVLDIREAAGLSFDRVWFADLSAERWPAAPNPAPFIPVAVQREAGCPEADVRLRRHQAALGHARLAGSTPDLVQSRPVRDGDTELMPSPLLGKAAAEASPTPFATLAARLHGETAHLDVIDDDRGPPHPGGAVPGGTGLIRLQSQCPRSAFLGYRLGAMDHPFNQPGLDPARRGTLVHRLLDVVWRRLGNSRVLANTGDEALDVILLDAIAASSARDRAISGCGDGFFEAQQQWLLDTLREWFALERARTAPFEVVAREEKATLQLDGLELSFMIDRMDRFGDGSLALIDYKTGTGQSIPDWFSDRPREPQLPLYVLSRTGPAQPVSVVAFARVRLGECRLDGILDPDHHDAGDGLGIHQGLNVQSPQRRQKFPPEFTRWQDHIPHWQATLGTLARDFRSGDARINPGNGGLCPTCPTPAFCRSASRLIGGDDLDGGEADA